ncbi:MAG: hypothetical protein KIT89_09870 [Microcella sp.]|uniref:hypothetical protein n=1 Tax=Microcella sp. TaxID=1913979 RepID=UPI0024CDC19E|nr:hypothetical protein [Microcella sp.]UYN83009.1 MAG: hypothetical protein KIT89_09870 [Microcella sp.]
MNRRHAWWGGAALAAIALGGASFAAAAIVTATPEAHVLRYLDALADDDLVGAAVLAGLPADSALPLGDDGRPEVTRVVERVDRPDGAVEIVAEYGALDDVAVARFVLAPAAPHLGIVPVWQFAQLPIAALDVGVDHHDRLTVNGRPVQTGAAGAVATVAVFVPSRVTASLADPFVRAESITVRVDGDAPQAITLEARPTDALERAVLAELEIFMTQCTAQQVLLPTGCPFGRTVADRVVGRPQWQLDSDLALTIVAGDIAGRWNVIGTAEVRLTATVQRLRDGGVSELDDVVTSTITGEVVLQPDGPRLTIYSPRD